MDITVTERNALRDRRVELKLRQEDVAARMGVTPATISNLESGRTVQPRRSVYARWRRALRTTQVEDVGDDETFRGIIDGLVDLDARGMAIVAGVVQGLRNPH